MMQLPKRDTTLELQGMQMREAHLGVNGLRQFTMSEMRRRRPSCDLAEQAAERWCLYVVSNIREELLMG